MTVTATGTILEAGSV